MDSNNISGNICEQTASAKHWVSFWPIKASHLPWLIGWGWGKLKRYAGDLLLPSFHLFPFPSVPILTLKSAVCEPLCAFFSSCLDSHALFCINVLICTIRWLSPSSTSRHLNLFWSIFLQSNSPAPFIYFFFPVPAFVPSPVSRFYFLPWAVFQGGKEWGRKTGRNGDGKDRVF